jgi:hypothetical protein
MTMRAKVTGLTESELGTYGKDSEPFVPQWVEIERHGTEYYLIFIDEKGGPYVETLHDTVQEAQLEASSRLVIEEWTAISHDYR